MRMVRAGIFIGVDRTGNLQKLNDAAAGARRMADWALSQGLADQTHVKLITDADGQKVHPDLIFDAIKELIDGPGVDQLLVYFAGHGVNINRNETWLLTDAPVRPSAAVNVSGSVELARYCGIQHVVIVSDACRVAPEGIQAQNVRGVDVFPNEGAADRAKPVDQFFACFLGKTAAEIKDPGAAASSFNALYTNVLLDALKGARPEVLEPGDAGDRSHYVRPRKLESYLETEVPRRVKAMGLEKKVNQSPDAIITSDASWVSRIDTPPGNATRSPGPLGMRGAPPAPPTPQNLRTVTETLVGTAVKGNRALLTQQLRRAKTVQIAGAEDLAGTVDRIAVPFGPDHFESECGIKVRGARIVDFFAPRASARLLGAEGDLLRIDGLETPAVSILLRFEGGVGTVIPAIPGFLAALTFDDGELVDVAYEPSVNTPRWQRFKDQAADLRTLRTVAASSSRHGRFRLDLSDSLTVAQKMQDAKGNDPTLAVYAAYAYHDLQAVERIRDMSRYLRDDIGVTLFDLALLGRMLIGKSIGPGDGIVPFVPLLSQGWALLGAHRVKLHPRLEGIESTMRDSLWSLFDDAGLEKLRHAMETKEVR
ncbi:MAG TPA: hypothetical protein VKK31_25350 [Thermoanaerobaculia bacterium]|nr:hypothetical protein [Thermoanaerobaculia bacterium]